MERELELYKDQCTEFRRCLDEKALFIIKQQLTINELQDEIAGKDRMISTQRTELVAAREKIEAFRMELDANDNANEKLEDLVEFFKESAASREKLAERLEAERNALLEALKLVLRRAIPRPPVTYQVDMSEAIKPKGDEQ